MRWLKVTFAVAVIAVILLSGRNVVAFTMRGEPRWAAATEIFERGQPAPPPVTLQARVYAELPAAPLIVDRRVRVFANLGRVWAEPLAAPARTAPVWSYQRRPGSGVAPSAALAVPGDARSPSQVVIKWSDGQLVGLEAITGAVRWRATGVELQDPGYPGGRTGAHVVYPTSELYGVDGLVISAGRDRVRAFDPKTGKQVWTRRLESSRSPNVRCDNHYWTSDTAVLVWDDCAQPRVVRVLDARTGRQDAIWRPGGVPPDSLPPEQRWKATGAECAYGASGCHLVSSSPPVTYWRVSETGDMKRLPSGGWVAGDVASAAGLVIAAEAGQLVARTRDAGTVRWRVPAADPTHVIADAAGVYYLTRTRLLVGLDPATGRERSRQALPGGSGWQPFAFTSFDGFVIVERVDPTINEVTTKPKPEQYYGAAPVLLVGA